MLRGRQASLVRLMPSLCTGMVNTMAVQRCWLAFDCKGSCCTSCGGLSVGSCEQTLLAAVPAACRHNMGAVGASAASAVAVPLQRPVCGHCSLRHTSRLQTNERCEGSCCMFWGAPFARCLFWADLPVLAVSDRLQARH